ncbi:hypothetical protein [Portibacter marinus]|uniref:hypothetical protein n=1 Tax=Portibacter marinus TaxID=2898660 RepID=UPI001F235C9E|nr:hypothetical protein [Portibacter marinus]
MRSLLNILFLVMVGMGTITSLDSCRKVEGCTDEAAENYDPDADVSDGSCVYARDKFIGTYAGVLNCQAPLPSGEEFTMVISESLTSNSEVLVSFQNLNTPLPELVARVEGDQLFIDPEQVSVALNPMEPTMLTDVEFSGEATIAEDLLGGQLNIKIVLLGTALPCDFTAMKQ